MVTGNTKLVGIIGDPVAHSFSPVMHNAAFSALELDWVYVPLHVYADDLSDAMSGISALRFAGVNVTVPHKSAVIPFLSDLSEDARRIGAVNTIKVSGRSRTGFNTDWIGFLKDLETVNFSPTGNRVLILGSGGSAHAVAYALAHCNAEIVIFSRNACSATELATHLQSHSSVKVSTIQDICQLGKIVELIVNTTPLGMSPNRNVSPLPENFDFRGCELVYDLVYNPGRTKLLQQASRAGTATANGLGMLLYQAAEAFRIWTDIDPPIEIMRKALQHD